MDILLCVPALLYGYFSVKFYFSDKLFFSQTRYLDYCTGVATSAWIAYSGGLLLELCILILLMLPFTLEKLFSGVIYGYSSGEIITGINQLLKQRDINHLQTDNSVVITDTEGAIGSGLITVYSAPSKFICRITVAETNGKPLTKLLEAELPVALNNLAIYKHKQAGITLVGATLVYALIYLFAVIFITQ
ncbi:hypothetical protein LP316_05335 [Thalassotalea sp. LPB0316]|uniref:hypothetical protein n=1 Tax=Thalassotalea sp. LPB0316 TaxID=2769490 RepID=UPI001865BCCD|nr:hypothetical protein [Thalassotalea sp. LPB0316]QOL26724.1 hypothetical protein LP316_05335 [Thalassotalea sp. LPB0316]